MDAVNQCLHRMALLDRAAGLLNEARFFAPGVPVRDAMARHRALLGEAGRHLETARSLDRAGR